MNKSVPEAPVVEQEDMFEGDIDAPPRQYKEVGLKDDTLDAILSKVDIAGLSGLGSVEDMRNKMESNLKRHQVIIDFVNDNFIEGIDYGPADDRNSKPVLLKPGAEKICQVFDTHVEWVSDFNAWKMLGRPPGTVCKMCFIVDNATGKIIGQGRGAEKVGNRQRDANKAIKNAENNALKDAALYTFGLSGRFTQDLKGVKSFIEAKRIFQADVTDKRSGVKSSLTDNNFIIKVCEQVIHKKSIATQRELELVSDAICSNQFDFSTGEKIENN